MKYLLCFVLLVFALGTAAPPLYYAHALPLKEALFSGSCIAFMCYLFDPTSFLGFCAEMRKNATTWFKKGVE